MAQEEQIALAELLSHYAACITYQPLRTEVAALELFPSLASLKQYQIPPRAALDPIEEAAKISELFGSQSVAILIPGKKFDAAGTRHGQGGGWYDRFLARVPREWLRIGFCFSDQFSSTLLVRESWDQSMDYVVVVNRVNGDITLYSPEGVPTA